MKRLSLAIGLFLRDGWEYRDDVLALLWTQQADTDDPLEEWVVHSLYAAWVAWQKGTIPERGFSDRLVHFLGLPTGLILHPDILDPHQIETLLFNLTPEVLEHRNKESA